MGEEHHLSQVSLIGEQHHQPVHPDTETACRRHTHLQGPEEVLVDRMMGLGISGSPVSLDPEAGSLIDRIVQFGEGIDVFAPRDEQFEPLDEALDRAVPAGQWRDVDRVVDDERGVP